MNKLLSVKVKVMTDDSPDTSHLGAYTDEPADWAIVCAEGEYLANLRAADEEYEVPERGREYRFFVPGAYTSDELANDEEVQKYGREDFERMKSLDNGDWRFIGIRAVAEVSSEHGAIQRLSSGGLWGIESDSEGSYFGEVAKEELGQLRAELEAYGVDLAEFEQLSTAAIEAAEFPN